MVLFGLSRYDEAIPGAWPFGHVRVDPLTPAAINYVVGYVAKKVGQDASLSEWRVNAATGEYFKYQPPFIQMSRRPGIGSDARKFVSSWREYAVNDGIKMAVPRYLHDAWKASVDDEAIAVLKSEKALRAVRINFGHYAGREALLQARLNIANEGRFL